LRKIFIVKALLIVFVFAIVIGGTFPVRQAAVENEKLNHYDTQIEQNLELARVRYNRLLANPGANLDDLLNARSELATALWAKQEFQEAVQLYTMQMAATWGLKPNAYNEKWVNACRQLADIHRDANQMEAALICYKSVYDHDSKYLPADDLRVVRDLNNLAMIYYMRGTGFEEKDKRHKDFAQAETYLKQVLTLLEKAGLSKSSRAATAYWNLYLVVRDQDRALDAESYRKLAEGLDKSMNRLCREP